MAQRRIVHQMLPVHIDGPAMARLHSVVNRNPSVMKPPHSQLVFPALLALATGAVQVNLPAVADPVLSVPNVAATPTTSTAKPAATNVAQPAAAGPNSLQYYKIMLQYTEASR